jgi:uncharacterized membrane protein
MTRALFLTQLRQGLKGLPPEQIDDICFDYEAHFADAAESGRSEADVSAALGNPALLAREWRAESGLRNWEEKASPGNFLRAGWALAALSVFDIVILLPLLLIVLFAAFIAIYVFYALGITGFHLMIGLFFGDGVLAPALVGVGMLCGAVAATSLIALLLGLGLRLLGRYVRMRYRFAKPTDPNA